MHARTRQTLIFIKRIMRIDSDHASMKHIGLHNCLNDILREDRKCDAVQRVVGRLYQVTLVVEL
jgi:hypothetical protein